VHVTSVCGPKTHRLPLGPWAGTMAVIVACGLCVGVEDEVRWPRSSQTILVSSDADGFMMSLMLKDIARSRRNCGTNSQCILHSDFVR